MRVEVFASLLHESQHAALEALNDFLSRSLSYNDAWKIDNVVSVEITHNTAAWGGTWGVRAFLLYRKRAS